MAGTCMSIAKLDQSKVEKIQELERELGTGLIAVEPRCHWSDLDEERLRKLQEAEEEMGLMLLAYQQD